ncbi:hypothetical protein CBL_10946 [Carabus blaptoides fortunei]
MFRVEHRRDHRDATAASRVLLFIKAIHHVTSTVRTFRSVRPLVCTIYSLLQAPSGDWIATLYPGQAHVHDVTPNDKCRRKGLARQIGELPHRIRFLRLVRCYLQICGMGIANNETPPLLWSIGFYDFASCSPTSLAGVSK